MTSPIEIQRTRRIPTYAYNASAQALGGTIRQGKRTTVVPTIASVCLASAGGEASNSVENYFRDDISFTRAQTRVSGYSSAVKGDAGARRYFTYADVLLTNLQVFERMKINFMQATVTSERTIASNDPELELRPDLSRFTIRLFYHGIEADGDEVVPDVDIELCHAGSYADFLRLLVEKQAELPEETQKLLGSLSGGLTKQSADSPQPAINAPLVKIKMKDETMVRGNRVTLPNFGRARFGEVLVKPDRQRVTLLRLTLDSDWEKTPNGRKFREEETVVLKADAEARETFTFAPGRGDGDGGAMSTGDSASNGIPIWP
ncbi:MAG TPA: hypothetical protein VEU30_16470 [Thermoanaerobaculia bacterium]|nr:hypothetical protein [Thermoanaerobaculia bacterium]